MTCHNMYFRGVIHTCCAKVISSDWLWKKSKVAASFSGRLSYAASSQLAISFLNQTNKGTITSASAQDPSQRTHLIVPIKLSTKNRYSSAGASSRAFHTLL